MKFRIAALALGLALPGLAAARPAPVMAADAGTDAEQLVGILLSQDAILELGGRAFDYGITQGAAADSAQRELYAAHPGMREYVASRMRPEFQAILSQALPGLRRDLSAIVISEMTPGEIADTLAFFASPTGIKMKAQIYQAIGDKPDRSQADMEQQAVAAAVANLTSEDYPVLMAFGNSSAAQKMQQVTPRISAAGQAWAQQMIAANNDRLRKVAGAAQAEFLAKRK